MLSVRNYNIFSDERVTNFERYQTKWEKTELHFDQFMRLEKNVLVGLDSFCGQVSYNNLNIH